eukprot:g16701.t1
MGPTVVMIPLTNLLALSSALAVGYAVGRWMGRDSKGARLKRSTRAAKRQARIRRSEDNSTSRAAGGLASPPSSAETRPSRRSRHRAKKLAPRCLALDSWTRVAQSYIRSIGAGDYESLLLLPRACFVVAGRFASFAECRHQLVSLGQARAATADNDQLRLLYVSSSWSNAGGDGASDWAARDFETTREFLLRNPDIGYVYIGRSCVEGSSTGIARSTQLTRVIPALLRSDALLVLPPQVGGNYSDFRLGSWSRMVLAVAAVGQVKVFVAFRAEPLLESVLELELGKGNVREITGRAADELRDAAKSEEKEATEVVGAASENWLGAELNPLLALEKARDVVAAALKTEDNKVLESIRSMRPVQTPGSMATARAALGGERVEGERERALSMLLFTVLCSQPKERATYTDDFLEDAAKMEISYRPIAVVKSPYRERFGTPRQPQVTASVAGGAAQDGQLLFFKGHGYEEALKDLSGFDMIWVISHMHLNKGWNPKVRPPRLPEERKGLFSTRSPHRPNAIALSSLRVDRIDVSKGVIHVHGLDLLDGTPVLDIKPYIAYCDAFPNMKAGWLDALGSDHEEQQDFLPKFSVGATLVHTSTGPKRIPGSPTTPSALREQPTEEVPREAS